MLDLSLIFLQLTPHLGEDAMQHKINHPKVDAAHWPASGWMD